MITGKMLLLPQFTWKSTFSKGIDEKENGNHVEGEYGAHKSHSNAPLDIPINTLPFDS